MSWYLQALKKYAVFSGRARRREYWFFVLFNIIVSIILGVVDVMAGMQTSTGIGILSAIDINKTGWWILIGFIPVVGAIVLIIFALLAGTAGDNDYGPDPKAAAA